MTALYRPSPPIDAPLLPSLPSQRTARPVALMVVALAFICCLPYPALNIGNSSALQMGNILCIAVAALVLATTTAGNKPFYILPLLLVPLCVSALKVAATGNGDMQLALKALCVIAVSGCSLLAAQFLLPQFALEILIGIAAATLLHVAVGFWQYYCFRDGLFPFASLYVNQSFLSVQRQAFAFANYEQRPFGLFPEPSAMSSSLAPWIIVFVAQLLGLLRLRRQPSPAQRLLLAAAAIGGLALIILSQSGLAAVTVSAVALLLVIWFPTAKASPRNISILLVLFGLAVPVVIWALFRSLESRVHELPLGNGSWEERSSSLAVGFSLVANGDIFTMLFGLGPGHSAVGVWKVARLQAVYSILLTYIYETGIVGLLAVTVVARLLFRAWSQCRFNLTFPLVAAVWLIGVTVTTSYPQLLPPWIALAFLLAWPTLAEPANPRAAIPAPATLNT